MYHWDGLFPYMYDIKGGMCGPDGEVFRVSRFEGIEKRFLQSYNLSTKNHSPKWSSK